MPMTPFIGVRISWLMLARKSDLSRDASVALVGRRRHRRLCRRLGGHVGHVPIQPRVPPSVWNRYRGHEHDRDAEPALRDLEPTGELSSLPAPSSAGFGERPSGTLVPLDDDVPVPGRSRSSAGDAGDLGPARVCVDVPVVGVGLEDPDRRGVGEQSQLVRGRLRIPICSGQERPPCEQVRRIPTPWRGARRDRPGRR